MLVCDVCKKNKATRKITYPTTTLVEEIQPYGIDVWRAVHKHKREDAEYDICQQCWDMLAMNRSYAFQLAKEMMYNKVNESEMNKKRYY